jgi:glycosyltransferase involved in cell wall biosynthesis
VIEECYPAWINDLGVSFLDQIAPIILTYNEAPNIARCLGRLDWARNVLVIDSFSKDDTLAICDRSPNVRVIQRHFDCHANQWNFALESVPQERPWILALDADYILSDGFLAELSALAPDPEVAGYRCRFQYAIYGRVLRASLYPPTIALFRRARGRYVQEGHTQRAVVDGRESIIVAPILHDDRKPLSRWFASQQNYALLEAQYLLSAAPALRARADRIRRVGWPAPLLVFFHVLLVKGCILDGWAGWFYALQRLLAETMIALALVDRRLRGRLTDNTENAP